MTSHICLFQHWLSRSSSFTFDTNSLLRAMWIFIKTIDHTTSIIMCTGTVTVLHFSPILLFLRPVFSFLMITHPLHIIGLLTPLVFIITPFHLLPQTSLTHSWLLICTSLQFHCIPPCSICFTIIPDFSESQIYKPSTHYSMYFPKLDLLCTLVHHCINLASFPSLIPWLFENLCQCSELVTCPQKPLTYV